MKRFIIISLVLFFSGIITHIAFASDSSLVGYWKFDESSIGGAASVIDSSGYGNNGTPYAGSGAIPAPSTDVPKVEFTDTHSLSFDNTGNYVDVGTDSSLNLGSTFTLSAWVKITANPTSGNYSFIISKDGDVGGSYDLGLKNVSGTTYVYAAINDGSWSEYVSNTTLPTGSWHQISAVRYSDNSLRIFVDGITVSTFSGVKVPQTVNNLPVTIGKRSFSSADSYLYDGLIDDVRIYSRSLSTTEIAELAGAFVFNVKTDNPGTSSSVQMTIPTHGGGYNYNVDWGDGNTDSGISGNKTHTYGSSGTYSISILGTFPGIYFDNGGDRRKIISIEQWGTNTWTFMNHSFEGASNLISNATDVPDLSSTTDMSYMFHNATLWNANMNSWNVSNITLMNWMFYNDTSFNQPLNSWDVSHVTDMSYMFGGDSPMTFNQPLNTWNVSSATLMNWMFYNDTSFNQPLNSWDVSHVTDMSYMFQDATAFNQSLTTWNIHNVSIINNMFTGDTLPTSVYDSLLAAWSAESLQSYDTFDAGNSLYCSSSVQRANIINTHHWTINDGGSGCSVSYIAGSNGTLTGSTTQVISLGGRGTAVTAIPNFGYSFTNWSDNSNTNPRTDVNITGNISVTANFSLTPVVNHHAGGFAIVNPSALDGSNNLDFIINGKSAHATSPSLIITMNADPKKVSGYAISLDPSFSETGINPYQSTASFDLPHKYGKYTLYLKYFSITGNSSNVINHSIIYNDTLVSTDTNGSISKGIFDRSIGIGDSGNDVKRLQQFLNNNGFYVASPGMDGSNGHETNLFGVATKRALSAFQKTNSIYPSSGFLGPKTKALINSMILGSLSNKTLQ